MTVLYQLKCKFAIPIENHYLPAVFHGAGNFILLLYSSRENYPPQSGYCQLWSEKKWTI